MTAVRRFWRIACVFSALPVLVGVGPQAVWARDSSEWIIRVDASKKLGPLNVKNFMYVQGGPLLAGDDFGSNEASRQFEIAAWKGLNLTSESFQLVDDEAAQSGGLIKVLRSADGAGKTSYWIGPFGPRRDLYLDTQGFEENERYWHDVYGTAGVRGPCAVTFMPKILSSNPSAENYGSYPPKDYSEWRSVLEEIVRYLNRRGVDDPYIILFGEPESDTVFNVLAPDGTAYPTSVEPLLREYVRLYAESQRAVKSVDPGAKVSAMCAGVWSADLFRELRAAPEQKGLDDFIAYVAEYNESLPPGASKAELDNICWQGYAWKDEKRMAPMVEHIQSVLQRHGFDPNVPQYLSGWSGGWASPQGANYPLGRYSAHLVYNAIEQLNPGGKPGPIQAAHYYTWNLEDESNKSSLVRTVHDRIYYGPAPSNQNCLRPAYIAFQALKTLEAGEVLAIEETRPVLVRSIAVSNDAGIHILLVNYTDERQEARFALEHLPETAGITEAVLRHVPSDEVCGADNWFPTEDLTSTFLNESAQLVRDESGAVYTSVVLPPNAVVLLDIPSAAPEPARTGGKATIVPWMAAVVVLLIGGVWVLWGRKKNGGTRRPR